MTRYLFHLVGPEGRSEDSVGLEFDTVDLAWLEANRAALEIATDMLEQGQDPSRLHFEICDAELGLVSELPFREVMRLPTRRWPNFVRERDSI